MVKTNNLTLLLPWAGKHSPYRSWLISTRKAVGWRLSWKANYFLVYGAEHGHGYPKETKEETQFAQDEESVDVNYDKYSQIRKLSRQQSNNDDALHQPNVTEKKVRKKEPSNYNGIKNRGRVLATEQPSRFLNILAVKAGIWAMGKHKWYHSHLGSKIINH